MNYYCNLYKKKKRIPIWQLQKSHPFFHFCKNIAFFWFAALAYFSTFATKMFLYNAGQRYLHLNDGCTICKLVQEYASFKTVSCDHASCNGGAV